jgi:hypothetical protein
MMEWNITVRLNTLSTVARKKYMIHHTARIDRLVIASDIVDESDMSE